MVIYIAKTDSQSIQICEQKMAQPIRLYVESRTNHTAQYPLHTRYFSNGDKPYVLLFNTKNQLKLLYNHQHYLIEAGEFVLFDDNVLHAWEMKNNDMTIYYYRAQTDNPVKQGTYCLDAYFDTTSLSAE